MGDCITSGTVSFFFFCSAGIFTQKANNPVLVARRPPEQYEKILRVNVVGPFLTTNAFLPLLRNNQSRVVVNMSSSLGSISVNRQGQVATPDGTPMNSKMVGYCSSSE